MRNERFLIIDDFYSNPTGVRELARNAEYLPKGVASKNFAGEESVHPFFSEGLVQKFEAAVGAKIKVEPERNAFGRFRKALEADRRRTRVHSDNTDWTAVIYLTPAEHCRGGTQFFRHRETGLDGPPSAKTLEQLGMTQQQFDIGVVFRDSLKSDCWDVVDQCDMRFNRCVLLRGRDFYHGSDQLFGENFENARLTQNFFFDIVK